MRETPREVRVLIVGAGFSGLGMGIALMRQGLGDLAILERENEIGGTWRDNTYPGCQCDVPSNLYSFSFALNPDWTRTYSPQPEIWEYLKKVAAESGVSSRVELGEEMLSSRWDEISHRWEIETSRGSWRAQVLILANGALSEPAIPELPGRDRFKGTQMHSAAWDHAAELEGKTIAVVGTGASAIQIVPRLQKVARHLFVFQRTPSWVLPHTDRPRTKLERRLFRVLPPLQRLNRALIYLTRESLVLGMTRRRAFLAPLKRVSLEHLRRQVPDPELQRKLTPRFELGCKRLLLSNDFYPSVAADNCTLVASGVSALTERGIVTSAGEAFDTDVIVWATGFHVIDNPIGHRIKGRDGATLADVWRERGMGAYLGTAISGFPNMFMLTGPNTGQGHTSLVFMAEAQMRYIIDALRFMSSKDVASVEVTAPAVAAFNRSIDRKMRKSVWTTGGCVSWYLDEHGRNPTLWPDFTWRFRALTRRFDPLSYSLEMR